MALPTVLEIITDALVEMMAIGVGETATADDANTGLRALNRLVDQWGAERLNIAGLSTYALAITGATTATTYAVGSGLSGVYTNPVLPIPPPTDIVQMWVRDASLTPPLDIACRKLTPNEYNAIPQKALTGPRPLAWYYDRTPIPGETAVSATVTLWPVPTTALTLLFYYPRTTSEFVNFTDVIYLPYGYREMLVKNLAVKLCPSFGRPVSPDLRDEAERAIAIVKRSNIKPVLTQFEAGAGLDTGITGRYDINSDRLI